MSASPGQPKLKEPEPKPGIEVGDELYVHHRGQPCAGRVACHGQHGVTCEIDGKHAKVPWDKVLGHKRRVALQGDVVDQGEDGMIVQDKSGRRRFIAVPNEATEDPMVAKSQRPTMLFMKAAGAAPGPGLTQKRITDKNGVQTTRWVSTVAKSPPAQPGQHVGFVNGEHRGHGKVLASGKHGVTVRDGADGTHRVHHEKVTHHWEGEGAPDHSPHEARAAGGKPSLAVDNETKPEDIARALFDTSELDKLPVKAKQTASSWGELETKGKEGLQQFKGLLGEVAKSLDLETGRRPSSFDSAQKKEDAKAEKEGRAPKKLNDSEYMLPEHWDNDRGFLFMGSLKGRERAEEKVRTDYDGDWSQVRDMVRATIAVPGLTQVPGVLKAIREAGLELAQKPKNNLVKPLPGGYRDLNLIVKLPNGLLAELQVHVKPMTLAKEKGHKPYEVTRSIEGKYREKGITDREQWDPKDREAHQSAMAEQERLYGDAWNRATQASSNLTKSMPLRIMVVLRKETQ